MEASSCISMTSDIEMPNHLPRQKDLGNRPVLVWNKHQIYHLTWHVLGNCPGSRDGKLELTLKVGMGISTAARQKAPVPTWNLSF